MKVDADKRRILQSVDLGAAFFTALAYPDSPVDRDSFAGAIICKTFDGAPEGVEDVGYEAVRLASVMQDRAKVDTAIRGGVRIINEQRLEAAFAAWPEWVELLRRARGCEPIAAVPTHASKAMLDRISAHIIAKRAERSDREGRGVSRLSDDGGIASANILNRVWKESLPVLHMALALCSFTEGTKITIDDILHDTEKCGDIIRFAELIRDPLASLFKIKNQFPALRTA
jgi:hypothetical protein